MGQTRAAVSQGGVGLVSEVSRKSIRKISAGKRKKPLSPVESKQKTGQKSEAIFCSNSSSRDKYYQPNNWLKQIFWGLLGKH